MPTIPSGVICLWPGTNAAVGAGALAHFSRVTALDGQYPRGAAPGYDPYGSGGPNPGGTGGATGHAHGTTAHTHTLDNHAHVVSSLATGGSASNVRQSLTSATVQGISLHGHGSVTIGGAASDTASWPPPFLSNVSEPARYTVIYVVSDGNVAVSGIPMGSCIYWFQPALPTGWSQLLAAKAAFCKGADAGTDAGTATAGAAHSHLLGAHNHNISVHTHGPGTAPAPGGNGLQGAPGASYGTQAHTHAVTPDAGSPGLTALSAAQPVTAVTTYEPPYNTLTLIRNDSGGQSFLAYMICLWRGALSAIPAGWSLCDGTNGTPDLRTLFIKNADNLSDIGTTGGAIGHTHTAPTEGHTHAAAHTHGYTVAVATDTGAAYPSTDGQLGSVSLVSHTHAGGSTAAGSPTVSSEVVTILPGANDTRPPYVDVVLIMYTAAASLTITSPAASAVEALPTFTVTWAWDVLRMQVTYQLFVYAADGVTVIYDSLPQRSAALSAMVPAGYLQNGTTYKLQVVATDSGHQTATSPMVTISTSWSNPPTPGGLGVTKQGGT